MAARFDAMPAVSTSELEPLPHQLKAVYGELLARTPLRFLLAEDLGADKTVMACLHVKELMLRGDLARCLIVAPGGLVDQWQEELLDKFNLHFELLTRRLVDAALDRSAFERYPLLIARMDQLSRSEELPAQLEGSDWDLVVVDEAHRMSAHYFGTELKTTRRYQFDQTLGRVARHLLLMTTTSHAGKEEDFQLFLALLDGDRFEGRYRNGVHSIDTDGLMRRMVKEELLTFEGKPLFRSGSPPPCPTSAPRPRRGCTRGHAVRARRDEPRRPAQGPGRDLQSHHRRLRAHRVAAPPGIRPGGDPCRWSAGRRACKGAGRKRSRPVPQQWTARCASGCTSCSARASSTPSTTISTSCPARSWRLSRTT